MAETVLVTTHENWVEVTLNRPDKLNSFTEQMHIELRSALIEARDNGARAILLTGSGRGFCAGQDLGDRDPQSLEEPIDLSQTLQKFYNPLIALIRSMEFPVICAVNGVAAGAGANVALACDIVVASDSARFIQSFANIGLVPDAGGTWSLTHLLGEARAKGLAMTAEPISAQQAEQWGLIWKCIPENQFMDEARALAERLAQGPTRSYRASKIAIQAARHNSMEEQLDFEAGLQKECGSSPDFAEGVSAFLEKRQPKYTGRAE